jgi:protein-S-isoprenylcysteine O-methyltransferase Ste14
MEFFPDLKIGFINGWLLLGFQVLIQGSLMVTFPKNVNERLLDRSGWTGMQKVFLILGKLFSLLCLLLIILTPLKTGSVLFLIGILIYILGMVGLVSSMISFRNTPQDSIVSTGLYNISRHPQIVSLFFLLIGMSIAIGSWIALLALLMSRILQHPSIVAEEEACTRYYGDAYRSYAERVPRYLLF